MKKSDKVLLHPSSSVLFATFSAWENGKRLPTNGSVEPLRDFLVPRIRKLVLIDQLVPGGKDVMPRIEAYTNGNTQCTPYRSSWFVRAMKPLLVWTNRPATVITFKIRDFLSVIDEACRETGTFDYLIGVESINAIAGIVLRKFGKVKKVIYYVSDYSPNRYANLVFNAVYLWLDRYAATHADFIWDVSLAMQPARISAGLDAKKSAPVIHVANGLFPDQIKVHPASGIHPHALVFMGTVGPENGPDVAIEALSLVRKNYPDAMLHMIGGSPKSFAWLIPRIQSLGLQKAVIHHGFVPRAADMAKIMRTCGIGLAPYRAIPGSPRYYGDAGKIRAYCASGLPVVSSTVPPLGKEVADKRAAIVCPDNPDDFAAAISHIFSDRNLYNKLRTNAIKFARTNTWENQFIHAFRRMHELKKNENH